MRKFFRWCNAVYSKYNNEIDGFCECLNFALYIILFSICGYMCNIAVTYGQQIIEILGGNLL